MSKQTSLITFEGKMDGISFYKSKGSHYARKASGPDKRRIMTDPKFKRTRENISEFTALAIATKSFRRTLSKLSNFTDGNLRGRLAKVFRAINKRSEGIRGQRPVELSKHRDLLKNINLNAIEFTTVFAPKLVTTHDAGRNKATLTAPLFSVAELVSAPEAATHFRLVQFLGIVPDTIFNQDTGKYEPVAQALQGINEVTFSDYLPLRNTEPVQITLETNLPANVVLTESVSVMQGIGIVFYEKIGIEYYPFSQNNAMQIVDIF